VDIPFPRTACAADALVRPLTFKLSWQVEAGALPPLIGLLGGPCPEVQTAAAMALAGMACDTQVRRRRRSPGCVQHPRGMPCGWQCQVAPAAPAQGLQACPGTMVHFKRRGWNCPQAKSEFATFTHRADVKGSPAAGLVRMLRGPHSCSVLQRRWLLVVRHSSFVTRCSSFGVRRCPVVGRRLPSHQPSPCCPLTNPRALGQVRLIKVAEHAELSKVRGRGPKQTVPRLVVLGATVCLLVSGHCEETHSGPPITI
jgi:hypothetical protein